MQIVPQNRAVGFGRKDLYEKSEGKGEQTCRLYLR